MFSPPVPQVYSSLRRFIQQTLPDDCPTRFANQLWLLGGMFLSRSVQLNLIARKMPIRAKKLSTVKRFSRFLDNPQVRTRVWYDPLPAGCCCRRPAAGRCIYSSTAPKSPLDFG